MTKREITSMIIKIMGIFCLVQFAPSLVYLISYISQFRHIGNGQGFLLLVLSFLQPAIWIGLSIFVISKSDVIAKRLYPEDSDVSQLVSLGFQDVQILGYNFIGLLLLVHSTPQIIRILSLIKIQQMNLSHQNMKDAFYLNILPQLFSFLTQFILGGFLFLKPRGLVNLWRKAQSLKYKEVKPDNKALENDSK